MRTFWFFYGPLAAHLLVAIIVWFRRRQRGGSWSALDTAACLVGPFAFVLCWAVALGFGVRCAFPQAREVADWVTSLAVYSPPLICFWLLFLHTAAKKERGANDA